ncbi:unnamed protein product [Moneuplotes crassus]|uniref:Uncharacterized protein n=1 Tax=Euplotes crassus TaxID=5936 RepID=A0AAD2D2T6_EUPCR|nr:unnamed protein product [Moneuplotes crassus]
MNTHSFILEADTFYQLLKSIEKVESPGWAGLLSEPNSIRFRLIRIGLPFFERTVCSFLYAIDIPQLIDSDKLFLTLFHHSLAYCDFYQYIEITKSLCCEWSNNLV